MTLSRANSQGTLEIAWLRRKIKQASANNGNMILAQERHGTFTCRSPPTGKRTLPSRTPEREMQTGHGRLIQWEVQRAGTDQEGMRPASLGARPRLFCSRGDFTRPFRVSETHRSPSRTHWLEGDSAGEGVKNVDCGVIVPWIARQANVPF